MFIKHIVVLKIAPITKYKNILVIREYRIFKKIQVIYNKYYGKCYCDISKYTDFIT